MKKEILKEANEERKIFNKTMFLEGDLICFYKSDLVLKDIFNLKTNNLGLSSEDAFKLAEEIKFNYKGLDLVNFIRRALGLKKENLIRTKKKINEYILSNQLDLLEIIEFESEFIVIKNIINKRRITIKIDGLNLEKWKLNLIISKSSTVNKAIETLNCLSRKKEFDGINDEIIADDYKELLKSNLKITLFDPERLRLLGKEGKDKIFYPTIFKSYKENLLFLKEQKFTYIKEADSLKFCLPTLLQIKLIKQCDVYYLKSIIYSSIYQEIGNAIGILLRKKKDINSMREYNPEYLIGLLEKEEANLEEIIAERNLFRATIIDTNLFQNFILETNYLFGFLIFLNDGFYQYFKDFGELYSIFNNESFYTTNKEASNYMARSRNLFTKNKINIITGIKETTLFNQFILLQQINGLMSCFFFNRGIIDIDGLREDDFKFNDRMLIFKKKGFIIKSMSEADSLTLIGSKKEGKQFGVLIYANGLPRFSLLKVNFSQNAFDTYKNNNTKEKEKKLFDLRKQYSIKNLEL